METINRRSLTFVLLVAASTVPRFASAQETTNKPHYAFPFAFGGKGSGNGQFDTPMGIAIAPSGNIIVADTSNARVQVFDRTGKFLSMFGDEHAILLARDVGSGKGKFWFPRGVAVQDQRI